MTIKHQDLKKRLLKNSKVKTEYNRLEPEYELINALIEARSLAGLTQAELAEIMHTTQSVIARLESGRQMPTIKTLFRYAKATGTRPEVRLKPREDDDARTNSV
jgi:transcriptional regulator with XRE-family HTH domain